MTLWHKARLVTHRQNVYLSKELFWVFGDEATDLDISEDNYIHSLKELLFIVF